ncbi:hypothetical protein HQ590_11865, partial [bacterium]|nr:hypothetical protein [bacterium]
MPRPSPRFRPTAYTGDRLNHVAFPLGGIGAGMICLEGTGALSHVSVRHRPEVFNEPQVFAALHVAGTPTARVLEGPVPGWKTFFPWGDRFGGAGNGLGGKTYGLPRFAGVSFRARFPFGEVTLRDRSMPVTVTLTGWSPFVPGDADRSSLPIAALEYRFANRTAHRRRCVFSFHAAHFLKTGDAAHIGPIQGGFALLQPPVPDKPWEESGFAAFVTDPKVAVDCAWFRGGWFDPLTMLWRQVAAGQAVARPPPADSPAGPGGSLYLPFTLGPRRERTIRLLLAWYVPRSDLRVGTDPEPAEPVEEAGCGCADRAAEDSGPYPGTEVGQAVAPSTYVPWYAARFDSLGAVADHWREQYAQLRDASRQFSDCFYDTTLPAEVVEAVAANLTILKSPTCLRQTDGRFWAWEGCCDTTGCCAGSCTHVWNYAQALPHLFPGLERSLRETEFGPSQDERGHQNFRAFLPIRPADHQFHAAADGQLGGLVKLYRDWRISGDTAWMKSLWPRARRSLEYAIATWDTDHTGLLVEPHHNTYDIEFWGPDGMCSSFYLAALQAAVLMGRACGDDVTGFAALCDRGQGRLERDLWNGEYFHQQVKWQGLRAADPTTASSMATTYSPEARAVLEREGPKYQYGTGCLADGVLGDWLARVSGLPPVLNPGKVAGHLGAVYRHNYRASLADHANTQRPGFALGSEGGLVLCTWPRGGRLSVPFPYSDEVWTGFEYSVASHLVLLGNVRAARQIVRTARARYDGRWRNPFDEYECGHWYARALSSYALLGAL